MEVERTIHVTGVEMVQLLGFNDSNLQILEENFGATILVKGENVAVRGPEDEVRRIEKVFKEMIFILNKNGNLTPQDVNTVIDLVAVGSAFPSEAGIEGRKESDEDVILYTKTGLIRARTAGQKNLVAQARRNDVVFTIGPAGTGKTYLAVALAVAALKNREVTKVVLARPAVEAGESLGFLPGDYREKIDPYLRPLYDALDDMISSEKLKSYIEKRIIEIAPLAYMRGRTLHNSFIILDEAQNATTMQMKMALTRLGARSRMIITGDITQIDLPAKTTSGLVQIQEVLRGIQGISFVYMDKNDIVRHRLVQDIVEAYDKFHNGGGETRNGA